MVASGTDAPVEPVDPIANFYAAVTRKTLKGVPERLRAGTETQPHGGTARHDVGQAYAGFEEQDKGSIEVGKLADLTVLNQDLITVPEAEILNTEVLLTMVGGEVVYQWEDYCQSLRTFVTLFYPYVTLSG